MLEQKLKSLIIPYIVIFCAMFYCVTVLFTAMQGAGKTALRDLTYEIPRALAIYEARQGSCSTTPVTSDALIQRGAPKLAANSKPWTARSTGESYEVVYPYSGEDDHGMTQQEGLLDVVQTSSYVRKAEIVADGVKVTYFCQQPTKKK